ncbi:hypothetical protein LCGC14_1718590 [marine sediment metagenome]|uniref:Uncharacterized protein n=1 Tax=marine sediment metagenome TaxID=412755 RepID=A0A0F9I0S8_9ZZZZ
MMPAYITGYRWLVFTLQQSDEWRPKFESWSGGGDDGRVTVRMFGKEFVYSAEWSKYPPETHPPYEPLKAAPAEIAKFLRRKLKRSERPGLLARIRACLANEDEDEEETYCDGCKRFSRGNICPNC